MSTTENESNKRKGPGRPRLETTLPPTWYEIIVEAGKNGKHITNFLIELGISWEGHYALLKRNKKYYEAFMEYQKLCEEWWFNRAHQSMEEDNGMGFNSRLWTIIVKNKFKDNWKDEKALDVTTQGDKLESPKQIQIEILKNKIDE